MTKHRTAQELMAERNPLIRTSVAPVDIYSQLPEPAEEAEKNQLLATTASKTKTIQDGSLNNHVNKNGDDRIRPYSTYVRRSHVKGVKLRAIERELDDKDIVQEALDEYFKNHPLQ